MYHGYLYGRRTRIAPEPCGIAPAVAAALITVGGMLLNKMMEKPVPGQLPGAGTKVDLQPTATKYQEKVAEGMETNAPTKVETTSSLTQPPEMLGGATSPVVQPPVVAAQDPSDSELMQRLLRYQATQQIGA